MPRVIVTVKEPVYDPQAYSRAMKVLEEHFLEILLNKICGLNHEEREPETRKE